MVVTQLGFSATVCAMFEVPIMSWWSFPYLCLWYTDHYSKNNNDVVTSLFTATNAQHGENTGGRVTV